MQMVNQVQEKFIAVTRILVMTHVNVYREGRYRARPLLYMYARMQYHHTGVI